MKLNRRDLGALVAISSLTVAGACGGDDGQQTQPGGGESPGGGGEGKPVEGGEITIAWPSQPPTLDPVITPTSSTNTIAYNVFEGLVALDKDFAVQPMLAESWKHSDDYTEFTFKLRKGVKFHNGKEFTADDAVASTERWIADTSAGKAYFAGAKVTKVSENEISVKVNAPLYTGIFFLAQPTQQLVMMPKEAVAAKAKDGIPTDKLSGTGPFAIETMVVDQRVVLKRYKEYAAAGGEPSAITGKKTAHADKLIFNIVKDATTRVNGMQSGQFDFASDIPADNATQLKSSGDIKLTTLNSGILALVFNKAAGPMASVKVRQALLAAVDNEAVLSASYTNKDYFSLNGALAGPEQKDWYSKTGLELYNKKDPEAAKKLLEGNYRGETIRFVTTRDYPYMYNGAVVVADLMKKLGMTVALDVTDWGTVLKKIGEPGSFDCFVSDFIRRPVPTQYTFFNSTYAGSTNDPALSAAIKEIDAAKNPQAALAATDKFQKAFYDYLPALKFGDIRSIAAGRGSVGGLIPFIGPVFYGAFKTQ